MEKLIELRNQIDEIDAQLITLFESRMRVVGQVADYKRTHALPVLQAGREQVVVERAVAGLSNPDYAPLAEQLIRTVMELSRLSQHQLLSPASPVAEDPAPASLPKGIVGFQGVPGSFSEQALLALFGEACTRTAYPSFPALFEAIEREEIVCGVLPIENSSTGAIAQVYDLLGRYGFFLVGEHRLHICQNLAALPGATLESIRTVYSHTQGIEQSSAFLALHPQWETVHFHNTAISAQMVAQANDLTQAAICSTRAASLYGLSILAPEIQDNLHNTTRFILVARAPYVGATTKASIAFSLHNQTGTLFNILRHFSEQRLNLAKLESRPIPDHPWSYRFYLDFEGDATAPETKALLESLSRETLDFQFLGGYPAG